MDKQLFITDNGAVYFIDDSGVRRQVRLGGSGGTIKKTTIIQNEEEMKNKIFEIPNSAVLPPDLSLPQYKVTRQFFRSLFADGIYKGIAAYDLASTNILNEVIADNLYIEELSFDVTITAAPTNVGDLNFACPVLCYSQNNDTFLNSNAFPDISYLSGSYFNIGSFFQLTPGESITLKAILQPNSGSSSVTEDQFRATIPFRTKESANTNARVLVYICSSDLTADYSIVAGATTLKVSGRVK